MLHFFNCKKLKYIHDEPYTLTDSKNRKIKLKKGDVLILDDGAMYRSLKYKTHLFVELDMKVKEKKEVKTETKKPKDDSLFSQEAQNKSEDKPKPSGEKEEKKTKEAKESQEEQPSTAKEETEEVSKEREC